VKVFLFVFFCEGTGAVIVIQARIQEEINGEHNSFPITKILFGLREGIHYITLVKRNLYSFQIDPKTYIVGVGDGEILYVYDSHKLVCFFSYIFIGFHV
jgi:hypothetical protein